ncbi:MAG: E1 ubiquitin-activating protein uba2 [Icmadophila ericetorum]|nr:E1 ubiquitin-activating protein uba2 [Icmadophila ericetorum]
MGRDRYPKQSLGLFHAQIKKASTSRVLLVGAGGIGCELLKNLVLTGFGEIHIVDLDTIDLSNLNRQFLFRHEHIKKSKALVAKETALKFNPNVKIEAHHANIKDPQFGVDWLQTFTIVFNALDNLDARRHVNRMCLAADVPLIESGTTGFNGQVQVIKKGVTECYDCNTKETPKSFPVCTIRSTPSQPIHCIVWAKSYLFTEMFGTSEDEVAELDRSEDSENATELENLRRESQELQQIRQLIGSDEFPRKVFDKVFKDDLIRLRSMEDMWKTRKPPIVLDFDYLLETSKASVVAQLGQATWSPAENFKVFCDSTMRLSARLKAAESKNTQDGVQPVLEFDKDDEDILDFVAASANLRSIAFAIEAKSKFDIKQMAGNIIPAIATTNAMTAGLCVLQAFKVMRGNLSRAKMVFLEKPAARVINTDTLKPPNPNCAVCGVVQSKLIVDTERATLNDLVEDVLKLQLGYGEEFSVNNEVGTLFDPELDDNLGKKFSELGIKGDSFLTIVDDGDENPRVNLSLIISEKNFPEGSKPLYVPENLEIARKSKASSEQPLEHAINGTATKPGSGVKRKRSSDEIMNGAVDHDFTPKQRKFSAEKPSQDDNLIVVDDSGTGTILIDDD